MRCPYSDCQKDYNDSQWSKVFDSFINPEEFGGSLNERKSHNRIYLVTRQCRFCNRYFHEVYVGCEKFGDERGVALELLVTYPISRTKFAAKNIPIEAIVAFNEAERCRAVGSKIGAGGALRKSIYTVCDDLKMEGRDYREKISNLPVKDAYKELLKQIKWLGDNVTKPGEEKYTMEMIDLVVEILPILFDDLYLKEEKIDEVSKLLAKARAMNPNKSVDLN